MNAEQRVIVTPTFWGKFFGKIKSVELQQNKVIVTDKKNNITEHDLGKTFDFPAIQKSFFGTKLFFKDDSTEVVLSKLAKKQTDSLLLEIEKVVASNIKVKVKEGFQHFANLAENQYLRDSDIPTLNDRVRLSVLSYGDNKEHFQKYFDESLVKKIQYISSLFPVNAINAQTIRREYEQHVLNHRKHFFDVIESNPLTEQQRLSVIRNNDINMVLAAAGTGKTSVMVAKALDLIDSGACKSEDILILAYNRDAATELSERLQERAREANLDLENSPSISTFHALGRRIIKECGKSVHLSKFAEDPMKLDRWFNKWLEDYIKEDPDNLAKFIQLAYQPIDPFQFKTKDEYDRYVNDNDYRTLQGERVRGYQELLIANWLFSHSVEYEYEPRYVSKRRIEIGFDYKPDFSLGDGVYLEHFGIDRQGRTRADINAQEYNANIQRKRELHAEHNTTLLETYHYNWVENTLYKRLEQLMNEQFIPLKPKSQQEILDALNESGIFKENKNRYLKCLQAIRTERLDYQQILKRLTDAKIVYAKEYATLLMRIHDAYVKELRSANEIDFDDMILLATQLVKTGEFKPKWKHILVDEFQDISMARLELLKEIYTKGPRPIWTVVGDDWQSIYRFSGGKLEVTTRFNDMVGSHTLSKLEKTYRYNNSIADTAGQFIMQNPEQYQKNVVTHTKVADSCVHLYDSHVVKDEKSEANISLKASAILKLIRQKAPEATVAILARYRYLLEDAKSVIKDKNVKFWTFHGSKGLEADYCILLGFFQGKVGFPNQNKEEAVVEALLPMLDSFPHSEERRLFYVALTRAKKESYLIADANAPSEFINELLSPKYKIDIVSKRFQERYRTIFKCNECSTGYFVMKQGKFGQFYSCTSGEVCRSSPRICEKCGRPMKLREGKCGQFWGCSGYGIKGDQCTNTRKYFM